MYSYLYLVLFKYTEKKIVLNPVYESVDDSSLS